MNIDPQVTCLRNRRLSSRLIFGVPHATNLRGRDDPLLRLQQERCYSSHSFCDGVLPLRTTMRAAAVHRVTRNEILIAGKAASKAGRLAMEIVRVMRTQKLSANVDTSRSDSRNQYQYQKRQKSYCLRSRPLTRPGLSQNFDMWSLSRTHSRIQADEVDCSRVRSTQGIKSGRKNLNETTNKWKRIQRLRSRSFTGNDSGQDELEDWCEDEGSNVVRLTTILECEHETSCQPSPTVRTICCPVPMPPAKGRVAEQTVRRRPEKCLVPAAQRQKRCNSQIKIQVVDGIQSCLSPTNIDQQQALFFSSGFTVNPVFSYDNVWSTQHSLSLYSEPKSELFDLAKLIMEDLIKEYGTESRYLEETGGDLLTREETQTTFAAYIRSLGLEHHINLAFAENTVSPTSITHDQKGRSTITIGLPIEYRKKRIQGVLDHEIGTHFLRKFNEGLQLWAGASRKRLELRPHLATEEGLASVNQLVYTALDPEGRPSLFRAALYYYAACMASHMSFAELFRALERYIDCPRRRFRACLRVKRGLTRTDLPGGMYKDQAYLEGAVAILRRRHEINFEALYSGKIALEDLERLQRRVRTCGMRLPWFLREKEKYVRALDRIAEFNHLV